MADGDAPRWYEAESTRHVGAGTCRRRRRVRFFTENKVEVSRWYGDATASAPSGYESGL